MSDQMSLDGILSGEERPAPASETTAPAAPAPVEQPAEVKDPVEKQQAERNVERPVSRKQAHRDVEQAAQGRVRDPETGQYVAKEAPAEAAEAPKEAAKAPEPAKPAPAAPAAAPQQEFTEREKAFLRAAQEERGKRQELERRIAAQTAPAAPTEPAKTFWDDPEGALAASEARTKGEVTKARLEIAELNARQRYTDFDEKIAVFGQVIQQTPGLHVQWLNAPDPAEFAYRVGKNHFDLQQAGGMEQMRAKIERETTERVRAQVEAELKEKADKLAKERAELPPSLSQARSTGPANRPVWSGPTPLDAILGK